MVDGKGKSYFSVDAKKSLIDYLHQNNRTEEIYKFSGAGSKMIDDYVVKFAPVEDLPFLIGTNGVTANKRIEKRMTKGK
jgi:hypothetical protein